MNYAKDSGRIKSVDESATVNLVFMTEKRSQGLRVPPPTGKPIVKMVSGPTSCTVGDPERWVDSGVDVATLDSLQIARRRYTKKSRPGVVVTLFGLLYLCFLTKLLTICKYI